MTRSIFIVLFLQILISSCTKSEKVMPFNKDGKWGLINSKGEIILKPKYSNMDFSDFGKKLDLIKVEDTHGKIGYIDFKGSEIIPLKYERGTNFTDNLAVVCIDGSYPTIIDKSGKEKQIEGAMMASKFQNGYAVIQKARKHGFINKNGELIIPPIYLNASGFSEGLAAVQCDQCFPDDDKNSSYGKWGYIDESGKMKILPKYDLAFDFDKNEIAIVKEENKVFFIDKFGNQILNRTFNEAYQFSEGLSRVKIGENYGYINENGNEVIPFVYTSATDFSDGYASVKLKDGTWGVIDKKGKFVIQPIFDELSIPFGGSVFFEKGNEKGLRSIENDLVLFSDFDGYYKMFYSDLIIFSCKIDFEKIIKDVFSEDNFPYFPILTSTGFSNVEYKVKRDKSFLAWKDALISMTPKFLSENAVQESGSIFYDNKAHLNIMLPLTIKTTFRMPAFSGDDIEKIKKLVSDRVNKFEGRIEEVFETNVDPSKFDSSLIWEYADYFIIASFKWDLFNGSPNDMFLLELYVSFK